MTKANQVKESTMKTITLPVYVNKQGKARDVGMFEVLTVEDVRAWSIPKQVPCTCDQGYFTVTVSNHDHADNILRLRAIECKPGDVVKLPCTCEPVGVRFEDVTPSHVWFVTINGDAREAKVNGKVRTWKRDTTRVELPLKYGMYEYATFDASDIEQGRLLRRVK